MQVSLSYTSDCIQIYISNPFEMFVLRIMMDESEWDETALYDHRYHELKCGIGLMTNFP